MNMQSFGEVAVAEFDMITKSMWQQGF